MAKILISSGPTRQYIDPVRYISNASSGQMGCALSRAAVEKGHDVTIVSGPVNVEYPSEAKLIPVVSTEEMLQCCLEQFQDCHGMIGTAAPCDYRPVTVADHKIKKNRSARHVAADRNAGRCGDAWRAKTGGPMGRWICAGNRGRAFSRRHQTAQKVLRPCRPQRPASHQRVHQLSPGHQSRRPRGRQLRWSQNRRGPGDLRGNTKAID